MNPSRSHPLPHLLIAALAAAIVAFSASPAVAAESPAPPRHQAPYGLDWLNYVTPEDLPPTRYATCIVDSGLLVTPDTPASSSAGPVLERVATDGGSGEPQGTHEAQLHGTQMTMAAIAPANGWGTIGTAGWARVVSVRAMVDNETTFRGSSYRRGIFECQEASARYPIAAVTLSLGCDCEITSAEQTLLAEAVESMHDGGISVAASAGNRPGVGTGAPARFPGFFAVAAGSATGGLCSYSSFDSRVDVLGPACPIDTADPLTGVPLFHDGGGSSTATAIVGTLIAALRTLRPDATYQQVEAWIRDSARLVDGRRVLDGEAAARAAGLGAVVDRARGRMPKMPPPTPEPSPSPTATPGPGDPSAADGVAVTPTAPTTAAPRGPRRLPQPRRVQARWRRGLLQLSIAARPRGTRLQVKAEYLGEFNRVERRISRVRSANRLSWRLRRRPDRLSVRLVAAREFGRPPSKPLLLKATRTNRFR